MTFHGHDFVALSSKHFDLVVLFDVIEHVLWPRILAARHRAAHTASGAAYLAGLCPRRIENYEERSFNLQNFYHSIELCQIFSADF